MAFDLDLPRGVWLEGQVKDKATGRGVQAQFQYLVFQDPMLALNPVMRRPVACI